MSYASTVVCIGGPPQQLAINGKEFVSAPALITGSNAVKLQIQARADSTAGKFLATKKATDLVIASGDTALDENGSHPVITASVICDAHPDQYLNEIVIVGRIGSEARDAESGKSTKRSIAVNRYQRDPATEEIVELTDWFGVRAFGFTKQRLQTADKGALVEVTGMIDQLTNAKGEDFCEIKARSIRVHKGRKGGGANPASGKAVAGYDSESFMGSEDDFSPNWD